MRNRQFPQLEALACAILPGAIEAETYASGYQRIAGLDEVGRGPLAGPVVAAAVVFAPGFSHPAIKDSKALTPRQREKLVPVIKENALGWGIGIVEVEEIDRSNILNAAFQAMVEALGALWPLPDCLLVDGNQRIPEKLFDRKEHLFKLRLPQRTVVKGDRLCYSIGAASILAKVTRDAMMVKLDEKYPEYGFARHKGYGSRAHLEALQRYGPSPVHRRSFKPVRDLCRDRKCPAPMLLRREDNDD